MEQWMTISQYKTRTGLSREQIMKKIHNDELIWETTDGGGKYLIKVESNTEIEELKEELESMRNLVVKLCNHLGVAN